MRPLVKVIVGLGLLGASALVAAAAPAGAQDSCGGGGYLDPSIEQLLQFQYPRTVTARGPIHVEGSLACGLGASEAVEFRIADRVIGSVALADDGTFAADFTVPDVAAGEYTIVGSASDDLTADGPITVLRSGDPARPGTPTTTTGTGSTPLARTGVDATPMVTLGAAVLVLGAAAVHGSRRRRPT